MTKTYLGIDIGTRAVKIAVMKKGSLQTQLSFHLPENIPREAGHVPPSDALAMELKRILKREGISGKNCVLVLPPDIALVRRITVPHMTVKNLKVNLPYEFQDYIQNDKSQYFYDYLVVGDKVVDSEDLPQLDLLAAVSPKETIASYRTMLRKAGLKLMGAVPEALTYRNLITAYEQIHLENHPKEYCIVDMGCRSIRVHMYRGNVYETTRVIDYGESSHNLLGMETGMSKEEEQEIRERCGSVAVEILRAVNFYGYNSPESDLQDVYFGGGMAKSNVLMEAVKNTLNLNFHSVTELLPPNCAEGAELCFSAVGAAMEGVGRKSRE